MNLTAWYKHSFAINDIVCSPKAQTSDLLLNLLNDKTSGDDHLIGNFEPRLDVYSSSMTALQQEYNNHVHAYKMSCTI